MTDTQTWKWTVAQIAIIVVALPFFAAVLVWTWDMPDLVRGLILVAVGLAVGLAAYYAWGQRDFDEMEFAARGFAARWSTVGVFLLLLFASVFEPFRAWLNEVYPLLPRHAHAEGPEQMFMLGVLAALVVRGLGAVLLRAAWMQARR